MCLLKCGSVCSGIRYAWELTRLFAFRACFGEEEERVVTVVVAVGGRSLDPFDAVAVVVIVAGVVAVAAVAAAAAVAAGPSDAAVCIVGVVAVLVLSPSKVVPSPSVVMLLPAGRSGPDKCLIRSFKLLRSSHTLAVADDGVGSAISWP